MRPRKARGTPGLGVNGVPGESMAEDKTTPPNDEVIAVSDEALQKAESFVEAEEGAANRLMGWAGKISTAIAVVMSLFHLYAAYAIVPTQELRYTHVAFTLVLSFLLFPLATRGRNHRLRLMGRRGFHRSRDHAGPLGHHRRHRLHRAAAGGDAAHHRRDHARGVAAVHRLRHARPVSAGAVDPSRL